MKLTALTVIVLALIPAATLGVGAYSLIEGHNADQRNRRALADLARQGKEAHDALCILREDLQRRVDQTLDFLRGHPNGIAGIDAKTIADSLANQQKTIDALSDIRCASD